MWPRFSPPREAMSEETREVRLARARKMLKDYQVRTGRIPTEEPSRKKTRKIKNRASPKSTSSGNSSSSEEIEDILKVLVSDLNRSNGVVLSPLDKWKVPPDHTTPSAQPANATTSPGSDNSPSRQNPSGDVTAPSVQPARDAISPGSGTGSLSSSDSSHTLVLAPDQDATPQNQNLNNGTKSTDEKLPLSSTESLRQISEHLNGLISESSFVSGQGFTISSIKELENRYQELCNALESSNFTNKQLSNKIEELKQQNQDIMDQQEKDKKDYEESMMKEHVALRQQLEVHIQTIGILIQEKGDLYSALYHTQNAVKRKEGELEDACYHLRACRQRLGDLEHTLSTVTKQHQQADKSNKELTQERDNLRLQSLKLSAKNEDLTQHNAELIERVSDLVKEKTSLQLEVEDMKKKIEMSELLIQQYTSVDVNKVIQQLQSDKEQLEKEQEQLKGTVKLLQKDRDHYLETLKNESAVWRQTMQQLSEQVQTLKEEKNQSVIQVQELEASLAELKKQLAAPPAGPPSGPAEETLQLQIETERLHAKVAEQTAQLELQLKEKEDLVLACQEQEKQMRELERIAELWREQEADRSKILETMESNHTTISIALTQNNELKAQLAELQNGFITLTNEKMELTTSLQSEQHVKRELAKKLGQLQEKLDDLKQTVEAKSQEAQGLQEQRDQYLNHLQQYVAAYQQYVVLYEQMAQEKEQLSKQLLLQAQHEGAPKTMEADVITQEEHLEASSQQTLQLQVQPSPKAQLEKGATLAYQTREESALEPAQSIPEDMDSKEAQVAFLKAALTSAEEEQARLREELKKQELHCLQLAHLEAPLPRTGENGSSGETHQNLQEAMEKLQGRFSVVMREKVDLQERLEQLEHRCVQLSGETDTIGEYIALYQSQRAVLKERHRMKEEYISRLAQDKEEMKLKMLEFQELVFRLVNERNEWYQKYQASSQKTADADGPTAMSPPSLDLGEVYGPGYQEVSLAEAVEPVQGEALSGLEASENSTAQQILKLLKEIQYPQDHPSLGDSPCIPFFYRPDERDEVRVLMI
ncbi:golgin subfamily A member 2 isoform X2 [Echinops telfairi]|uniref:Golgin subfamily A member 2 isoform X2 n=1 Tax=Echinops telfairi TaxID=9371 RepID=A0AC55CY57_ECHTE|nr:golgin subfamily A member 2 isoform X2 [Echinops telfairi]